MFITEMELLQARLAAGKRLNDSHILKEILQEDRSSERKRRMAEGERYYRGEHDSLQKDFRRSPISETKENGEEELRMFFNPNRSNHHCVHPFHHTLVAQKTAYLVGREPTISVRNGDRAFEEMLTELADEHFNGVLQSWLTGAANKGVEYLHVYYDGEGNFRYCIVPAEEIIAIYDEEYQQELREVIRYYDIKVLDEGREKTKRRVEWWTAEDVTYFTENGDGEFLQEKSCGHWAVTALLDGEETETEQHGWGRVPFIPLRNNEKELTDLQLVKGLIDAYDLVSSEGTNNLLDLVDLYWVIQGYGGETASAVAKKLQINKAVQISDSSGNVEAKQVQLPGRGQTGLDADAPQGYFPLRDGGGYGQRRLGQGGKRRCAEIPICDVLPENQRDCAGNQAGGEGILPLCDRGLEQGKRDGLGLEKNSDYAEHQRDYR